VSYRAGRTLFYRSNDPRIAGDGIACASCHPDGGDDGLTWSTPEGPRQTPALAGRVHGTAPYGWTRNMGTLPEYVGSTVERLGGSGLSGDELAALASFVERMPAPAVVATADDVSRGRRVFEASGCSDCHRDVLGTDHLAHEVGGGAAFDTPSLRFVGRSAPYFHDGRYPSLDALLSDPTSEMGRTAAISADDRRALASFLESL
jgi:cytochrome c peroxidase